MIHELRTYTGRAGVAPEMAKNAGTVGRSIRGDDYGKLEGYWVTEIGPLNQVMHLWAYESLNDRARLRAELAKNERWTKEYVPLSRANVVRQDIRLLNPEISPVAPAASPNIYEFRNYRLKPGAARQWLGLFKDALPVREKYSKIVALWATEAGQPNEVCHIWAYPDLVKRGQVRAAVTADPDWQAFLAKGSSLIEEMHSTIMLPAAHSPLK